MRILIISDVTGYMRGGVPAVSRELIDGLIARGHVIGFCGDIALRESPQLHHFPITVPTGTSLPAEVRQALTTFAPDFVHVMAMSSKGVFRLAPLLRRRAWLLTCHSIPPHEQKLAAMHRHEALHYGLRNARYLPNSLAWRVLFLKGVAPHVVVHSDWVGEIAARYGQAAERITMISLGCEVPGGGVATLTEVGFQGPRLVTTGGIAHTKGYHDAIGAVAALRPLFPGVQYQIIGEVRDASYLRYLQSLIERLGLRDHVRITPSLPNDQKQEALFHADLYVQPSHEEGFCLAYIEAAMQVSRLVGCDTGAIRLVSRCDEGAAVVPPRQPAALATAMQRLLTARLPADLMRQRFERLARDFSWHRYLDAHETLYATLMAGHSPTSESAPGPIQ